MGSRQRTHTRASSGANGTSSLPDRSLQSLFSFKREVSLTRLNVHSGRDAFDQNELSSDLNVIGGQLLDQRLFHASSSRMVTIAT